MGLGSILGTIGGIVGAPFTGGASLIPGLVAGGLGIAGDVLGNTQGARTSTSTPTIAPEYKTLADLLRTRAQQRLQSSTDLSGFTANGISGINNAYGGASTALNNSLTARGLATSPVAGTGETNLQLGRAGSIAQFLNSVPLLQRQFQNEDQNAATNLISQLGRGTSTVGAGSAVGAGLGSAGELLAYLNGLGAFGNKGSGTKTSTDTGSGLLYPY